MVKRKNRTSAAFRRDYSKLDAHRMSSRFIIFEFMSVIVDFAWENRRSGLTTSFLSDRVVNSVQDLREERVNEGQKDKGKVS